jgi:hypothetical protein
LAAAKDAYEPAHGKVQLEQALIDGVNGEVFSILRCLYPSVTLFLDFFSASPARLRLYELGARLFFG